MDTVRISDAHLRASRSDDPFDGLASNDDHLIDQIHLFEEKASISIFRSLKNRRKR